MAEIFRQSCQHCIPGPPMNLSTKKKLNEQKTILYQFRTSSKKIENPAKNFWQDCQDCFLPFWRKVLGKWKCCFIRQFNLAFPVFHQTYLCLLACFSLEGCQLYSECPEGSFWEKLSFRNFFHHYGTMCNIPSKVFSKLLFCVQRHRWLDSLWKTNIFDFSSFWCRSCFTFSWNYSEQ